MPRYTLSLFTVLAFMLAACGGNSTTPTPPPDTNPPTTPPTPPAPPEPEIPALTLSGTANGYTGAAGVVTATMQNSQAEVATGTIAADGSFSLELPGSVASDALISNETYEFCQEGSISISPTNWQLDNFFVLDVKRDGMSVGTVELSNVAERIEAGSLEGYELVGLYYAANAVTLSGTCTTGTFQVIDATFDMQLQEGWNYVLQTATEGEFSVDAATIESVTEPPADLQWEFLAAESEQPQPTAGSKVFEPGSVRPNLGLLTPRTAPLR